MSHIAVHREREGEVLQEGKVVAHVPVDRRLGGSQIDAVLVVIDGHAVLVVFRAVVDYLRVTRFLVHLGSLGSLVGLPDAVGLPIPDFTDGFTDKPAIAGIVHFFSVLIILVVQVLNLVLIVREAQRGVPSEVLRVDVTSA